MKDINQVVEREQKSLNALEIQSRQGQEQLQKNMDMEMEEKAKLEKKQKALKEIELEIEQLVDASEKNVSEQMAA